MVGRELHLPALPGQLEVGQRHHAGVVDEHLQRPAPGRDEGGDRPLVGKIEPADVDGGVARRGGDLGGRSTAGIGVPYGECDLGARARQRACGLDADARRAAGHDRALAAHVDPGHDLCRSGVEAERGRDQGVRTHECSF